MKCLIGGAITGLRKSAWHGNTQQGTKITLLQVPHSDGSYEPVNAIEKDVKNRAFKRAYLLYGEESYLIRRCEAALRDALLPPGAEMMNASRFEERGFTAADVIDSAETLPFLNEYRLIVLRDTGLFAAGRKDDSEAMADYMPQIPDTTVLLFAEQKADKRGRLYKALAKAGTVLECKTPGDGELLEWTRGLFTERGKRISSDTAAYLLHTVAHDMASIVTEAAKLNAYAGDAGEITRDDVDAICTKALEARVFELMRAIGGKRPAEALGIYNNMITSKESPVMILAMLARQLKLVLQCGYMAAKGADTSEIAARLELRSFAAAEYSGQSRRFTMTALIRLLEDCLETDRSIKTGLVEDTLGVETLIIKCCL